MHNSIMNDRTIVGAFETIAIPEFGVEGTVAKIDTGAWSGALHCTDIEERDGRLYFTPLGKPELTTSTDDYEVRNVRSSNGVHEDRYRVPFTVIINDIPYDTTVTLTDRTSMQYEMLIGRRFLRGHGLIVDVTRGINKDKDELEEASE